MADTHSRPDPRALSLLEQLRPSAILHAGDIGDLSVLESLRPLAPQLLVVTGNIDGTRLDIPELRLIDLVRRGVLVSRLLLTHIAVHGPRILPAMRATAKREGVGLVVCGHSHVPLCAVDRDLPVFNPGSIGPRRFHLPITLGLIEVKDKVTLTHLDCETGRPWHPPSSS